LGYELRLYAPQFQPTFDPDARRPSPPRRGVASTVSLSWFFSNARRFAFSISPEEGQVFRATLRRSGPELGGDFNFTSLDWRYQTYLEMPWEEHHVLGIRLAGGASAGDIGFRSVFGLGGSGLRDPLLQVLRGEIFTAGTLRGYRPAAFAGNFFLLGTAEYRFPMFDVDRGVSALPIYLRRLYGAVFSDAGSVGSGVFTFAAVKPSVGAELRAEMTLFYGTALNARLGLARGLAREGIWEFYLTLGPSF